MEASMMKDGVRGLSDEERGTAEGGGGGSGGEGVGVGGRWRVDGEQGTLKPPWR